MKNFLKAFIYLIPWFLSTQSYAQIEYSNVNLKYLYDLDCEVVFDHISYITENNASLFLKLKLAEDKSYYKVTYETKNSYLEKEFIRRDSLSLETSLMNSDGKNHYLKTTIPNVSEPTLIVFKVYSIKTSTPYYFDVLLDPSSKMNNSGLLLMHADQNVPLFSNYISTADTFRMANLASTGNEVFAYHYGSGFQAGDPPMVTRKSATNQSLKVDSIYQWQTGVKYNLEPGLFFAQSDTNSLQGFSFRVVDTYYPKYVTLNDLVDPLTYITTRKEKGALDKARENKSAFDKFWLEMTGSSERARRIIGQYYTRIADANRLFTSYKSGWKTDQGMIYSIFGPPDEVYRTGSHEDWIYAANSNQAAQRFTFNRFNNIFTLQHYVLERQEKYRNDWYWAVNQWRKGRRR
ncbi:MAG: GWxTD domain-containing protein [Bacteroidota bacterium]